MLASIKTLHRCLDKLCNILLINKTNPTFLDLHAQAADSCGTVKCNVDLNLSSQKQPDLSAPKTMWDSLDSTSRNNATVLHELSPPEMSAARIERVETHASRLHKDAFEFLEVGGSCKDDDKVSPLFSKEITPNNQCLQLFSEEKTSDIFLPVTTQPVAAASIASEQRKILQLGGKNNQLEPESPLWSTTTSWVQKRESRKKIQQMNPDIWQC
ncbi:uncharacterized protein Pyn_39916 [Prunus yedoensis var. nudiflora]|uniref:Uncharacterized protein n=1 Tax=Prunus yedoensis var. nudiflora TaxID=2094558 RepID=A0A314Y188_PRUYE|nr:uncharacterized protein Pyn_39916 [Prunus yedoensis var. nudiflora]